MGLTLLVSNEDSLSNLQTVTIVAASPFLVIIIALMFAIIKDFSHDDIYLEYREAQAFGRKLARERRLHREHQQAQVAALRYARLHHR